MNPSTSSSPILQAFARAQRQRKVSNAQSKESAGAEADTIGAFNNPDVGFVEKEANDICSESPGKPADSSRKRTVQHVLCLLYTSPSPRDA